MSPDDPIGAAEPIDAVDEAILAQVRVFYDRRDPPPPDLDERVRFAIALEEFAPGGIEVSRVREDATVGARVDALRTVTFESERLTIMLTVTGAGRDRRAVEGWIAPPGPSTVELRVVGEPGRAAAVDADGRFAFAEVPAGLGRFAVAVEGATVVTAPLRL